jgi:PAS domain S-box-containing protein
MAAFVALWRVTRGRNVLYGWLGLALIAFMAFNALAAAGGARYTLGWVLGRISGFLSASVLLVFFLGQFAKVHRSLGQALQQVRDANVHLERRAAARTTASTQANTALQYEIAERRQAEAALRDSAARQQAILQTAADGILTIDDHGRIEAVNPAAERLFGYPAAEMLGQNVRLLMPAPYREEHDGYLARYHQTGEPRIIGIGREVRGLHRDGTTFPMALAVSEVRLGDRRLFTGIVHDLTARVHAEEARGAGDQTPVPALPRPPRPEPAWLSWHGGAGAAEAPCPHQAHPGDYSHVDGGAAGGRGVLRPGL